MPRAFEGCLKSFAVAGVNPVACAQHPHPSFRCAACLTVRERAISEAFLPPPEFAADGGGWRLPPREFPPWQTALHWFLRLASPGVFDRMSQALVMVTASPPDVMPRR